MKKLSELFLREFKDDLLIKGIKTNSKEVEDGDLFVCIQGVNVDRHDFVKEAINNGAIAICHSKDIECAKLKIKVADTNAIISELYARFYDYPDKKLKLIGITGTDGKTSCATIVKTLIGDDKCGYIGTNGYACYAFNKKTDNTTPVKEKLYAYFDEFVKAKIEYVAIETSSEAFHYGRLEDFEFSCAAISNITSEHLNTHKTLDNYIECKKQLFKQTKDDAYSILNYDDESYSKILEVAKKPLTYGRNANCDLYIKDEKFYPNKSELIFAYQNKEYLIESPLLGSFNSENLAEALLICLSLGFKMEYLIKKINTIKISGRMEVIDLGQDYHVIVDYAHTPNGIKRLLDFVKTLDIKRMIVVIGQAGERDPYKRKDVGKIVADKADLAIFTAEDPRNENVDDIIEMMLEKIKNYPNYIKINDRQKAIEYAINEAKKDDIVLILGKGSENYQKVFNESIPFSDIDEAKKALIKFKKAH